MRVLVACEFSGRVREAFRKLGHDAWSNDIIPAEDHSPYHIQNEVELILEAGWDLMIAHPPCTYLASSGLHWNKRIPGRDQLTHEAMILVFKLLDAPIEKIALENPIGCISSNYRKPDQIIQPWQFGHDASKQTCLWLKNLPKLQPTQIVNPIYGCSCGARFEMALGKYGCPNCHGDGKTRPIWGNQTPTGQNKLGPSEKRAQERSRTYQGIANAMAEQWGAL